EYQGEDETEFESWNDFENLDAQKGLYSNTKMLVIVGLIMGVFLIIGGIIAMMGKSKIPAILFGILAVVFCLIAPMLFMVMHADAINEDEKLDGKQQAGSFMGGGKNEFGVDQNWGPAIGWYLAIASFVFALIGFIAALMIPKPVSTETPKPTPARFGEVKFQEQPEPDRFIFKPLDDEPEMGINEEKQMVKFETIGD
ncbi:MAG: hypothetical protein ACW98D_20900, partial [Promethearchaeota archaeon]